VADSASRGAMVWLYRLDDGLAAVEKFILASAVLAMAVNTCANVVARVGFNTSIFFAEELNRFLIVLVTFIGASTAARMGRHIRMSAFSDMLSDRHRKILVVVMCLTTAAILFMLTKFAIDRVYSMAAIGRVTPSLRVPSWILYSVVPVGLFLTGLQFLFAAVTNFLREEVYLAPRVPDTKVDEVSAM
jgi:TRAP-type C4-dicarboxylate transport system permease small subunit